MVSDFSVRCRKSNGNLHLRPKGDLDGSSAWVLIHTIQETYDGRGRVFIDTQDLHEIHPFGSGVFKCELGKGVIRPDCLFFKGKKGFEMAPNGSRVIVPARVPSNHCNGACNGCRCPLKRGRQN